MSGDLKSRLFRWLPELFLSDAYDALAKLETMEPTIRDYYASSDGSKEVAGTIDISTRGFVTLTRAMRKGGLLVPTIDGITLTRWARPDWDEIRNRPSEDVKWALRLQKEGKVIRELRIKDSTVLHKAVREAVNSRIATVGLVTILAVAIMGLLLIGVVLWA